jgi:hypothetical protein
MIPAERTGSRVLDIRAQKIAKIPKTIAIKKIIPAALKTRYFAASLFT